MLPTTSHLDTDRAFSDASKEHVLVLEGHTGGGDFVENVEVDTSQIAAILPVCANPALQILQRDLIGGDGVTPVTCGWMNEDEE